MGMMVLQDKVKGRLALPSNPHLLEVVREVRALLRSGERVFRVSRRFRSVRRYGLIEKYSEEILDIRLGKSGVLLQVRVPHYARWSTVWSSENLVSGSGEIVYSSPDFEELERQLSSSFDDLMEEFMDELEIEPFYKKAA